MSADAVKKELPNRTVELLGVAYGPYHWPPPGTFRYLARHIEKPWEGGAHWKGYAEAVKKFNNIKELLKPHEEVPVDCLCIAALAPPAFRTEFAVLINGLHVCNVEPSYKRLLALNKIQTPITTCNARIEGGGYLPDGRHRSYNIFLDLPPYKRNKTS
jgi:hypothetical protein